MVSLRPALLAAGTALCLVLTGCTASGSAPLSAPLATTACTATPYAALVPQDGALFGVNLDWGTEQLADYSARLGRHPAVAVNFADMPLTDDGIKNIHGAADQIRSQGGIMLLTLEPRSGLAAVTPDAIGRLVATVKETNDSGVPVIIRFAHEMNGSWYAWGQQPQAYVATFRAVAGAVHAGAPGTAMMWAPNYGGGYPFAGGQYEAKPGTPARQALDTNHDGVIDGSDDPYAPYYPGDDAVDWVGISLYHWGNTYPWGANVVPEPGKFVQQLTGEYNGAGGNDLAVPNFYAIYGNQHDKPVAIPETAALFNTAGDTSAELAIKQAWWRQVFSPDIPKLFPRLKMINWFEWDKQESEVGAKVDWTTTRTSAIRGAFTADLPGWLHYGTGKPRC